MTLRTFCRVTGGVSADSKLRWQGDGEHHSHDAGLAAQCSSQQCRSGPSVQSAGGPTQWLEQGLHLAGQTITGTTFGDDEGRVRRVGFELDAQAADLHVDRTVVDLGLMQARQRQQLLA